MKLYLAAVIYNAMQIDGPVFNRLPERQKQIRKEQKNLLESYHYFNSQKMVDAVRRHKERIFLDSGAFSAFTQGASIDLKDYCNFIKRNEDIVDVASVLDAIGDPLETYRNQKRMEQLGVKALPCFHSGEDFRYCEYYVANYEYITVGGMVGASTKDLINWLDVVWEKCLVDGAGRPKVKVHGFGITAEAIMERYPWWSVDSSSWLYRSSMGCIVHPNFGTCFISKDSERRRVEGQHYDNLSDSEKQHIREQIEELGFSIDELRDSYMARRVFCMLGYNELGIRMKWDNKIFHNEKLGLFD